jgi:hypothetical protein
MATHKNTYSSPDFAISKSHSKLALALWVKLQHTGADQLFDVLLTLDKPPRRGEIQQLEQSGLAIPAFHKNEPSRLLPGVISKANLEDKLIHCELIRYIEGIPHRQEMDTSE